MSNSDSAEDYSSRDVVKDCVNATSFTSCRSFLRIFRSSFRALTLAHDGKVLSCFFWRLNATFVFYRHLSTRLILRRLSHRLKEKERKKNETMSDETPQSFFFFFHTGKKMLRKIKKFSSMSFFTWKEIETPVWIKLFYCTSDDVARRLLM